MADARRRLAVSLPPERLELAAGREWRVELKLSRRHEALVRGEADLGERLAAAGVPPERVASVHLPPGLRQQGAAGMTVTRANLSGILEFVHGGLAAVPGASLVAHPPKAFAYADQLAVFRDLLGACDRRLGVENTPGASPWHRPEDVAFFGYLADREPSLDGLYGVVDSAHLPPAREGPGEVGLDDDAVAALRERLDAEGLRLPPGLGEWAADNVAATRDHRAGLADAAAGDPYFPLLRTLCLSGGRVLAVHLNDPVEDGAPAFDPHAEYPALRAALGVLADAGGSVVLEDGDLLEHPAELAARIDAVAARLGAAENA